MKSTATNNGPLDVLVVDADLAVGELVKRGGRGCVKQVRVATSVDQAQAAMKQKPADVLLVNLQISDNAGINLIKALRTKYPRVQTIAISKLKKSEVCLDAWRAGAADMLVGPLNASDIQRSLENILHGRDELQRLARRNTRLRSVCKQLNRARHEISQQVDLLCNDLVRAYQEMAQQLNLTQLAGEYAELVNNEVEVEGLLRRTMEWVLKKLGPINAAVFLPDSERKFALGAYLNLDTEADAALISAMGETIIKQADHTGGGSGRPVQVDDDQMIDELFGQEGAALKGRVWMTVGCFAKRECLAVLAIFRKANEPLDAQVRNVAEAIAPTLGEKIDQALGLYHRLHPIEDDDLDSEENSDL